MGAIQGTIEANDTGKMVEIVTKLTISCVIFNVRDNGHSGWVIEILGA